jgi:hypothetical protein
MSSRRNSGPQYLGSQGLSRNRPQAKEYPRNLNPPKAAQGYKTLSKDTAKQIAEALRMMLR